MGLSERKFKQRIGLDPRNLSWSSDTSRFSYKHMTSLGWNETAGIGRDLSGNPNHIAVARKLDNTGIGMARARKEGDDKASGAGEAGKGLEDVLKRLSAAASASPSPAPEAASEDSVPKVTRNRIASRQKHLHSKRLASQSPAALAEILGVPVSALPASPLACPALSPTPDPAVVDSAVEVDIKPDVSGRTAEETISTSTLSVSDYFRQKMREKMLARQSASGSSTPMEIPAKEVKIEVAGVAFEGQKTAFEEVKTEVVSLGAEDQSDAGPSSATTTTEDKAARKARKEAKRLRKLAEAQKGGTAEGGAPVMSGEEEATEVALKRKRKEEKRKRKDEKRAKEVSGATPAETVTKKRKRVKE